MSDYALILSTCTWVILQGQLSVCLFQITIIDVPLQPQDLVVTLHGHVYRSDRPCAQPIHDHHYALLRPTVNTITTTLLWSLPIPQTDNVAGIGIGHSQRSYSDTSHIYPGGAEAGRQELAQALYPKEGSTR